VTATGELSFTATSTFPSGAPSASLTSAPATATIAYVCAGVPTPSPSETPLASASPSPTPAPSSATFLLIDASREHAALVKTAALHFGATGSFSVAAYVRATTVTENAVIVSDKAWGSRCVCRRGWLFVAGRWPHPRGHRMCVCVLCLRRGRGGERL
jgi:hypothetical protein